MTPVDSTNIKAIGKDGNDLIVHFNSGAKWRYTDAGRHHDAMLKSDSAGGYFHACVKGNHEGQKIE